METDNTSATLTVVLDFTNGLAVPDLKAKEYVYKFLDAFTGERDMTFSVGTQVMFDEIRLAILTDRKQLYPSVQFLSHDLPVVVDVNGRIRDWTNIDDRSYDLLADIFQYGYSYDAERRRNGDPVP